MGNEERGMRGGFTLIEMLVVIGIIAVLIGVSIGSFSSMTKSAERAKAHELVLNVATALTALYQTEGNWPKRLATNGQKDGLLDKDAAVPLALGKYMSLTTKSKQGQNGRKTVELTGLDQFGIVTPWATAVIKRRGQQAQLSDVVSGSVTVKDHILHYALDVDGDGVIRGADVGGESVDVRATAIVWCIGKDGGNNGKPWPYHTGLKKGDVYSWTPGQMAEVK